MYDQEPVHQAPQQTAGQEAVPAPPPAGPSAGTRSPQRGAYLRQVQLQADSAPLPSAPSVDSLLQSGPAGTGPAALAFGVRAGQLSPGDGAAAEAYTTWAQGDIRTIQNHLRRLGLYALPSDGDLGKRSQGGLTEAFGSDEWRGMAAAAVIEKLSGAAPPAKLKGAAIKGTHPGQKDNDNADHVGDHRFRYGELFKDGVVDMTVGVGFDESENHIDAIDNFRKVLGARGFKLTDPAVIAEIYQKAGHKLGSAFGDFFCKKDALSYQPPVGGDPRTVDFVVRLVANFEKNDEKEAQEAQDKGRPAPTGHGADQGAQAAAAMKEGLQHSDIAYYSGHGRYGSGPDFDQNMGIQLKGPDGWYPVKNYEDLESILKDEGKGRRTAWQVFEQRIAADTLRIDLSNAGNLYLNPVDQHPGEFGGRLMYWCLNHQQTDKGGQRSYAEAPSAELLTGDKGKLADPGNRKYQIYVFDGCRTQDYVQQVKKTPGHGTHETDILDTRRTLNWGDEANTLAAFIDSILSQFSAEHVIRNMDQVQSPDGAGGWGGAYQGAGLEDNPVVK